MIYGYIRVSTDHQTVENQRFEIKNFITCKSLKIDRWIEETISGTTALEERKLGELLTKLKPKDILVASELSRLGRNLLQIMSILHFCMRNDIQVWTIKDNYQLGTDIQSKVLAFAFGLSAEIERNLISQRTKEALARVKASGKTLGRPVGIKNSKRIWYDKEQKINDLLARKVPKKHICRFLGLSRSSVYRFIADQKEKGHTASTH